MGTSKKDKDPSRAERKAKKRKLEDAIPDLPGDISAPEEQNGNSKGSKKRRHSEPTEKEDVDKLEEKVAKKVKKEKDRKKEKDKEADEIQALNGDSQAQSKGGDDDSKQEKKDKKAKKAKKLKDAEDDATAGGSENDKLNDGPLPGSDEQPRKSKKERKAEKKAAEAAQKSEDQGKFKSQAASGEVENVEGESQTDSTKAKKNNRNRDKKRKAAASVEETSEGKAARFIVFIGNLPFTATTESIEKHFAAVHPKSIRHLTKKEDPSKSRGCAFVEFEGYDHMKTCLKLFHHSNFDDGLSAPRKINVELTAGGGGKTKHRTEKIGEKNQKLNEQRIRRMQEEEKAKLVKRDTAAIDHNDVHPSRRARVPDVS